MLISFFKSSFIFQYAALLILGVILWTPSFIQLDPVLLEKEMVNPLFNFFYEWLRFVPWIIAPVAFIIVLFESLLLNAILTEHDLIPKNSLLGAMIFMVIMSSSPSALSLFPALIALIPCIVMMNIIYSLYGKDDVISPLFSLGLLVSVASLFYFSAALVMVLILFSLTIYRIYGWREWSIPLIGFMAPIAYLFTYDFWNDLFDTRIHEYRSFFDHLFQPEAGHGIFSLAIWGSIILLLLFPAMLKILNLRNSYIISIRMKISVNGVFFIIALVMVFINGDIFLNRIIFLPAAIFIAQHFSTSKKLVWNEILFFVLTLSIGINNYLG
jgi:hypothetical protein